VIAEAITLIESVPGYTATAADLRRRPIRFDPRLPDRARAGLLGGISLGPEPFAGSPDAVRVGLTGTLVHEHFHTRQNPLRKSWSFWIGILTRTHPMRRYEEPAYRCQAAFLQALADHRPRLRPIALRERVAALASFAAAYGQRA
jgi:hypothetical protein